MPDHESRITNHESRPKIAVIVGTKGRGSNMLALVRAGRAGGMPAEVAMVYGSSPHAPALESAQDEAVETISFSDREEGFGARLLEELQSHRIDLVCLAGYLRLLPQEVLRAYPDRVLNIHPALLPKFGGKGMYGMHVHEAVLAAGETVSGCSVHYVNEAYDEGAVILQRTCPVLAGDTPEALAKRVLEQEHLAFPEAVTLVVGKMNA